jgi:hypothetical protein
VFLAFSSDDSIDEESIELSENITGNSTGKNKNKSRVRSGSQLADDEEYDGDDSTRRQLLSLDDEVNLEAGGSSSRSRSVFSEEDIYENINSVVPTTDDPNTHALTFRVIFLGLLFATILSIVNTLFTFRTNSFSVNPFIGNYNRPLNCEN